MSLVWNGYVAKLGRQNSEYDNTLADYAEYTPVSHSLLDRVIDRAIEFMLHLYQYRSRG